MSEGFEYLEHAADARVRAWGNDVSQTFCQATLAMWSLVCELGRIEPDRNWKLEVTGRDLQELLVNVLNEQIFLFDTEGLLPLRVGSVVVTEGNGSLAVTMSVDGTHLGSVEEGPNLELKAVTYDEIRVTDKEALFTVDI